MGLLHKIKKSSWSLSSFFKVKEILCIVTKVQGSFEHFIFISLYNSLLLFLFISVLTSSDYHAK